MSLFGREVSQKDHSFEDTVQNMNLTKGIGCFLISGKSWQKCTVKTKNIKRFKREIPMALLVWDSTLGEVTLVRTLKCETKRKVMELQGQS